MLLVITDRDFRHEYPEIYAKSVIYRPKSLVLGLGCDSQTPFELVERGIQATLAKYRLDIRCVKTVASVDKKAREEAFLKLTKKYGWEFKVFTAEELDALPDIPNPSETVKKFIGTKGVAEPSALLAAGARGLEVVKQIYKEPEVARSMTIAVARMPFPARPKQLRLTKT
jgi:cobalt-precorrin 5A hydrolase